MVLVRRATPSDRMEVRRLITDYHASEHLRPDPKKVSQAMEQLLRSKRSGVLLVACKNEAIIGVAVASGLTSTEAGNMLIIHDLYVEPTSRRCGVGRALFESLLAKSISMKVERIELEILSANKAAGKFWRRMRFRPSDRVTYARSTNSVIKRKLD